MPMSRLRVACLNTLLGLLVAACGSTPDNSEPAAAEQGTAENFYVGSSDVFAHLVSGSGGSWQFTRVTASDVEPENGFLVRLNDLAPAFDTRVAECTPQAYPGTHKCSPAHPFRDKEVGVIKKIISGGIAAGTAGKVSDVSANYKTTFDAARFNQAVDEALINSGLDDTRAELIRLLETYEETSRSARSDLDAMRQAATARYHDTDAVEIEIQPTVTGLTEYYSGDLDLRELIELVPDSAGAAATSPIEAKPLLPCNARTCMASARRELASLNAAVETERSRLGPDTGAALDVYRLRCDETRYQGYLFRLECPPEIRRSDNGPAPVPLTLHIYARDFENLFPSVQFEDENLRIETDGTAAHFINKTPSYLSITTQTVYYNSLVETKATNIPVAPGARAEQPLADLVSPAMEIEASYREMTPDKARSTTFDFGLAANYRVAGTPTDSTLFMRRTFEAGCVIENRLRPGSCDHEPQPGDEPVPESEPESRPDQDPDPVESPEHNAAIEPSPVEPAM